MEKNTKSVNISNNSLIIYSSLFLLISLSQISYAQSQSRVELVTMYSPALGIAKNFNIYLPAGYDENVEERYPVVYLFRGHEREWVNRSEDASRNNRNIKDIADQLYQAGLIGRMILIMPGLSSTDNSIPGLGVNFVNVNLAGGRSGLGTGQFEDFLISDLLPYIDGNYRTLPFRSQRGIDGFSLGGYTSMMLVTRHPNLFCSAGAYDGTMMWLNFDDPRCPGPNDDRLWLETGLFNPIFGLPRDIEKMLQYNPANIIYQANSKTPGLLHSMQFLIHSADSEESGNLDRSQHIVDLLATKGIQNTFDEIRLTVMAQHNWWYADEHMLITLPKHWEKFQNPVNTIPLEIMTPVAGSQLSGIEEIKWSPGREVVNMVTSLFYSRNEGKIWQILAQVTSGDTSYRWNTVEVPDGTRYLLRALLVGDSTIAVSETKGRFTINNPGNAVPDIEILSPKQWDFVNGEWLVQWFADDADGDSLIFSMDYTSDNRETWEPLFSNLRGKSEYRWFTKRAANSHNYRLVLHCSDNSVEVSDTTGVFEIFNEREIILPQQMIHVNGNSSAKITAYIVDSNLLTGNLYRITFKETLFKKKAYDVLNVDTGKKVVENAMQLDGLTEGPLFDGIRLLIDDFEIAEIDNDNTGWIVGSSTLEISIYLPEIDLGSEVIKGFPQAADYKITIFDHVVDTSSSAFGAFEVPMKFIVWNQTENKEKKIIFLDNDHDRTISRLDEIFILEPDEHGELRLTWAIFFSGNSNATLPQTGDEFVLKTLKPLTAEDIYEFRTITLVEDNKNTSTPLNFSLFQNYPNPFNATTTIKYTIPTDANVTLTIYNILGEEVKTALNQKQIAGSHYVNWDGTNNMDEVVPSGLYLYQIKTGNFTEGKKMLLLR